MKYPEPPAGLAHDELVKWMIEHGKPDTAFEKLMAKMTEECSDIKAYGRDFANDLRIKWWEVFDDSYIVGIKERLLNPPEFRAGQGLAFLDFAAYCFSDILTQTAGFDVEKSFAFRLELEKKLIECARHELFKQEALELIEKEQRQLDEEIREFEKDRQARQTDDKAA